MKVRIIQAPQLGDDGEFIRYKKLFHPFLTLPTLAGLSPPDIDLKITQGFAEDIDFDEELDLVQAIRVRHPVPIKLGMNSEKEEFKPLLVEFMLRCVLMKPRSTLMP